MSRKFRVNASRKPVKCADAGSDVYFVILDSAGNIVSTSIVDADIADRTAKQLRSGGRKVRKFTNEADYNAFLDKCDESRRENSRMSKKSVGASTKRKSTIKASAKTDLTRKLSKLYNAYTAIDDDKALKRAGMTLAEYNALPDVFERLQKNGHVNTFMTGLANYFKKFGFSVSLDGTDYEITASSSTKRKFTVNASTGKSKTIEVHFNDGRKPAKYTASVLEDMMTESNVDYIIDAETGELIYDSEHGDVRGSKSVKCSALDDARDNREELSGTYYIVYNGNIIVETDGTGDAGEDALAEVFTMDADALAAAVEYLNSFGDDLIGADEAGDAGEVARVLSQFIQMEYDEGQMDPTYFGSDIYWDGGRIEWFDSSDYIDVDAAQTIECGDAIADRFMVDLMYQADGGYAEDRYFDDWSEVEAYAHDGLMRGFYARIWDKQTGDTITISPDEYAEAWENGAADFDINEDIVNFKNRVVTSSTKIQCDDKSGGTYCIVYNGKVIAETDGLYNGLDDCGESEIAEILLMDDAALKACADYVNSFGDPVLTGDEIGEANEVAMVLAEIISNDYADKSDAESFGDSISWNGNILEWFDSSDLADDVTSSTKIEAFRDDTVDETAVRELVLVITNDGDLYRQRTTPIIENLKKKAAKGTYDREKAVKLWQYLADDGVRMYDKEYGSGRGSVAMLNPATRRRIAEELRDYYEEEIMWDINHSDDDSELTTM